jgi:hypothetical protein
MALQLPRAAGVALAWILLVGASVGCVSPPRDSATGSRRFDLATDGFAFPNETVWLYEVDAVTGAQQSYRRENKPDYALRCFVLVRAAKLFHEHARFEPGQARLPTNELSRRIRRVLRHSPRQEPTPHAERVVLPGFAGLRELSRAEEPLLKKALGGGWQSYVQRGHWRIMFRFSRAQQERVARALAARLAAGRVAPVHGVRFPQLTINHAVLLFDVESDAHTDTFLAYDPNQPKAPVRLVYDRAQRTFLLPRLPYFAGGRVDVFEVWCDAIH